MERINKIDSLVNIFRAIGLRVADGQEATMQDVQNLIKTSNPLQLLHKVENAIAIQVKHDGESTFKNFQNNLAYDLNLSKIVLGHDGSLSADQCNQILNRMCFDTSGAADIILDGIRHNIENQEGMTDTVADQVEDELDDLSLADYADFQRRNPHSNISLLQYKQQRKPELSIQKTIAAVKGVTPQEAHDYLYQEIAVDDPIWQNEANIRQAAVAVENRNRCYGTNDETIRIIDVLMATSQNITKKQVLAFYENRAREQNQLGENGQRLSQFSPQRIDNVIGKTGIKHTETIVQEKLTKNLKPESKSVATEPLPDHKWRGYQRLAGLLTEIIKDLYSTIQTTGFVERLVGKYGKKQYNQEKGSGKIDWDTNFIAKDDAYNNLPMSDFFDRTQARMMADRVQAIENETLLNDLLVDSAYTLEDVQKGDGAAADAELQQMVKIYQQMTYCQKRVAVAENVLQNVVQRVEKQPEILQNAKVLDAMENRILNLADEQLPEESPEDYQKRLLSNNKLAEQAEIVEKIKHDKGHTPQQDWIYALETFKVHNDAENPQQKQASYKMLAELFSIADKYKSGLVTNQDLDDLMANAVVDGTFNPKVVQEMVQGLRKSEMQKNINQQSYYNAQAMFDMNNIPGKPLEAENCRSMLHDKTVIFLKEKFKESYAQYQLNQTTAETIEQNQNN